MNATRKTEIYWRYGRKLMNGALAAVIMAAVQLAGAPPASAVTGLHKVTGLTSAVNSKSSKTVSAFCPPGERVTGGGGWVFAVDPDDRAKVTLTELRPIQGGRTTFDRYVVTGAETTPEMTGDWWVEAYAMCAPASSLSDYRIVSALTTPSSQEVQAKAAAVCPDGQVVLGTGGMIINPGGQVALQVSRASGTGDTARVQAHEHEEANGYPSPWWSVVSYAGPWSVVSYAVCVNRPPGYQVVYGESQQRASESEKSASAVCPGSKVVHGAGAAIDKALGNVSLQEVYPSNNLTSVAAFAVENTDTNQNWDFIVAQAICAD